MSIVEVAITHRKVTVLSRLCSALAADPKMGYYGVTGERSTARPVNLHTRMTSLAVYPATPAGSFFVRHHFRRSKAGLTSVGISTVTFGAGCSSVLP